MSAIIVVIIMYEHLLGAGACVLCYMRHKAPMKRFPLLRPCENYSGQTQDGNEESTLLPLSWYATSQFLYSLPVNKRYF